ncbi:MAG: hypothetical protein ABJB86_21405 [Bacteroidota bacterium]
MNYFSITIWIIGRKKPLRGVRAFPATFKLEAVRNEMLQLLLYYYFKKDIRRIDVVAIAGNILKENKMHAQKNIY